MVKSLPNIDIKPSTKSNVVGHLSFWVVLAFVFTIMVSNNALGFFHNFTLQLLNVGFYALIIYFNIFYLFPLYLKQRKLSYHLLWLLLTAATLTPIRTMVQVTFSSTSTDKVYFIQGQYWIMLATFFIGGISTIYLIMSDWMKGQKEKQELTNQTLQSELKFLKSQINPHFLFNTLNSLYALTLKKSDQAPEIVLKLSEMMRYMLYDCNERIVSLEKEVKYIHNYLTLEELRHGKKIDIYFDQKGEINNQMIAPLMFIPFIENCFKHGVSHQISQAFVRIVLYIDLLDLRVEIENSKHATMPGVYGVKAGGIGLANVKRRLELLYPNAYDLRIDDNPLTYKVILKLKLTN